MIGQSQDSLVVFGSDGEFLSLATLASDEWPGGHPSIKVWTTSIFLEAISNFEDEELVQALEVDIGRIESESDLEIRNIALPDNADIRFISALNQIGIQVTHRYSTLKSVADFLKIQTDCPVVLTRLLPKQMIGCWALGNSYEEFEIDIGIEHFRRDLDSVCRNTDVDVTFSSLMSGKLSNLQYSLAKDAFLARSKELGFALAQELIQLKGRLQSGIFIDADDSAVSGLAKELSNCLKIPVRLLEIEFSKHTVIRLMNGGNLNWETRAAVCEILNLYRLRKEERVTRTLWTNVRQWIQELYQD